MLRAKAATREVVDKVPQHDKPYLIFNVDESGLTLSGRPKSCVSEERYEIPTSIDWWKRQ